MCHEPENVFLWWCIYCRKREVIHFALSKLIILNSVHMWLFSEIVIATENKLDKIFNLCFHTYSPVLIRQRGAYRWLTEL